MLVDVVPETNEMKTPDLLVSTKSGEVYVEVKLLMDTRGREWAHLNNLVNSIKKILDKSKRCLDLRIQAHRELLQNDHHEIIDVIKMIAKSSYKHQSISLLNKSATIYSEEICDWNSEFTGEYSAERVSNYQRISCKSRASPSGIPYYKQPQSISVIQCETKCINKTFRNNLNNAKRKEVNGLPYVVHVGLPQDRFDQLLVISDSVYEDNGGRLSKTINAVVVHGTFIGSSSKTRNPIQKYITAIPNFINSKAFPSDFKFSHMKTLDWDFPDRGEFTLVYNTEDLIERIRCNYMGSLGWMSSKDGRLQIHTIVTSKTSMRLDIINSKWGKISLEYDLIRCKFMEVNEIKLVWDEIKVKTFVDGNEVNSTELEPN
jgi:hypothetical protein